MSIEFKNISKSFETGKMILNDLSFELPSKKFSGLLGPSGCGKTTLLRIIAGLDQADQGSIIVEGEALLNTKSQFFVKPEHRNIGMVFQSYAVWPHMTVFDNIAFHLKIKKVDKNTIKDQVMNALKLVRLDGLEQRMPNALSGGQQQRVALARALVQKPRLLLLDEPLSNLDASLRSSMRSEIRQLQEQTQLSAIIVTHDWADAKALCDHIVVMNEGKIVQMGSPSDLIRSPSSSFVEHVIRGEG